MVTHGNRGDREDSRLDTKIAVHLAIQDQKKQHCRGRKNKTKKLHQNSNESARKHKWTTAMKGLYHNAYISPTIFMLLLLLKFLLMDHFSSAALFQFWSSEQSFPTNHEKKEGVGKKVNILTDCTIDRASSSLQQNGLPLTRTFVLKNKIKNMLYPSVEKSHTQLSTYGKKTTIKYRAQKCVSARNKEAKTTK